MHEFSREDEILEAGARQVVHPVAQSDIAIGQADDFGEPEEGTEPDDPQPAAATMPETSRLDVSARHVGGAVISERVAKQELQSETPLKTPRETRVVRVEQDEDGSVRLVDASPEEREEALARRAELREFVGDVAADHREPPVAQEADAFFAEKGLTTAKMVSFSDEELHDFRTRLADMGFKDEGLDTIGMGEPGRAGYSSVLGIIIVAKEAHSTEDLLISTTGHEKAHSTEEYGEQTLYGIRRPDGVMELKVARVGLADTITHKGRLLEEGYACNQAAEFARERLGMSNGPWPPGTELTARGHSMPGAYVWLDRRDDTIPLGSWAGYGLELLIRQVPTLADALTEARKSTEGLDRVAEEINSLRPDLCATLQALLPTSEDSVRGLVVARQAIADWKWQEWRRRVLSTTS